MMHFPFTFKLIVPGIFNPFTAFTKPTGTSKRPIVDRPASKALEWHPRSDLNAERSPSPVLVHSRKRRWEPSPAETSQSFTTIASTEGCLSTVTSKAGTPQSSEHEYENVDPEIPPPKRRRTLAGSIVSTAINACLIGTAVGLTVYRLWRNRSKQSDHTNSSSPPTSESSPPPPPYEHEWTQISLKPETVRVTPSPSRARKSRNTPHSLQSTRSVVHHRRTRVRPLMYSPTHPYSPNQPDLDSRRPNHEEYPAVEDRMDWIGDKLSRLIEEGKKALGREVVVMSDAKEDETDDGTGVWEEENPLVPPAASSTRSGSICRSKTPHVHQVSPPSHACSPPAPLESSPSVRSSRYAAPSQLPSSRTQATSIDSPYKPNSEDETAWTSPELRESMEKARARLRDRGM